jgi:cell division protein FtsI/penicillin-binding protein 2
MLSHALGFVGYKGNTLGGRYGLERYYNDLLKRDDEKLYVNFFAEVFSNVSDLFSTYDKSNREGDIVTTIEPSVQRTLERELVMLMEEWNAEAAGGLIIHPGTGAMYALGSLPDYDPNTFNTVSDPSVFTNPIVENVYEMGSIVKALTMAIGLDTGSITSLDTYVDHGSVLIDGARIANYDGRARGQVPMQEILNQSLNTGVVHIMQKTGRDDFGKYMKKFGVETRTGIDLPNEVRGLASNLESDQLVEYATASFGQGIAYSPIAMARALAALGNGGVLVTPHLVQEIDYSIGFSEQIVYEPGERVISEQTSDEISRMLVEVVDTALRNGEVKMPGYSIAAKTGTAQMPDPEAGGYLEDEFLHSFFGYFPAYDPEFLIFLYVIKPQDVKYASETLTDPFFNLTRFLIHYYEIPPDR